ncbi:MAG: hypothetical protein M5U34_43880 [Chloroflexi bacterium]|nr:hypothetical protein [Chloroflexota bacterium]
MVKLGRQAAAMFTSNNILDYALSGEKRPFVTLIVLIVTAQIAAIALCPAEFANRRPHHGRRRFVGQPGRGVVTLLRR